MRKENKLFGFGMLIILVFILGGNATYAQCPAITSFSPASGPANTVVTISGNNFSGITSVQFNGVNAAGFTIISNTEIEAVVPATATTGTITLGFGACSATSGTPFALLGPDCNLAAPQEIYISELYDHVPGSYGVIELYNPTSSTITFGGQYVLERYGDVNGSLSYTLNLPGSIGPESTYLVLSYGSGVQGCSVATNASMGSGINENDEFKLWKNGTLIDIARAPDETGYTVIRKPEAVAPSVTYSSADWNFFSTQSCADLGNHLTTITTPATIVTQPQDTETCENGFALFSVALDDPTGFSFQWKTLDASGNWINVTDGPNYSDATTPMLTVDPAPLAFNGNQYYCEITTAGCTLLTDAVQLTVSPLPVVTFDITQPTCTTSTGSLTITPVSGEGLTYKINNGPFQASTTFTGLEPGDYILTIQSSANCTTTMDVTIDPQPSAPTVATVTTLQPTCAEPAGAITVTGPLGGYTYSIDGTSFQSTTTFTGLIPGTYTVTVKNTAGCTSVTGNIVINPAPGAPAVADVAIIQPGCSDPTGTITVTAPIGTGLTYSIDGATFQNTTAFEGLIPGTYVITVKNAAGCTSVTNSITINPAPAVPDTPTVTIIQPTCTSPAGSITVTAPAGAGLTYSIDGTTFQSNTTFAGLIPGTYVITVKNASGCTSVTGNIIINAVPNAPDAATVTTLQPDCAVPTGTITVATPTGAGLTYSIDGTTFQDNITFAGLLPGTYTVTVKNADGCTSVTGNIIINPVPDAPDAATATTIQPTCAVPTGTITVTAPVGAGLTYSLDGITFQNDVTFAGLIPGTYTVTVKNAAGCASVSNIIVIDPVANAPAPAAVSITQPTCSTPEGTITITAPVGAGLTYSLDGLTFQNDVTFAGLIPGTYTVTVKNAAGCTSVSLNHIINAVPDGPGVPIVAATQPTCAIPTGTLTVTAPVGTGLTYSLDGTTYQTGTSFADLTPGGNYTVFVKNADGCTTASAPITIAAIPAGPVISGVQGCRDTAFGSNYILEGLPLNDSFDIAASGFEWRDETGTIIGNDENTFNVSQYVADNAIDIADFPISFELTVITETGCESTFIFTVENSFCTIPRGISPNNDTVNDNFDITGLHAKKISIFNRYGMEVYTKDNYTNQWFGQADNGDELPTGTYYYVIETPADSYTGWVYINRQVN